MARAESGQPVTFRAMGEIAVTMLPTDQGQRPANGALVIHDNGVAFRYGKKKWPLNYRWDQVNKISFEDPGRTKANVGAIVLFGVLGLAGRRTFSLIVLSAHDREYFFENSWGIAAWRTAAERIQVDHPAAVGKIYVEGRPVGAPTVPAVAGQHDVIDQIRKLGELHESGVLTAAEFEAKKAELLQRL